MKRLSGLLIVGMLVLLGLVACGRSAPEMAAVEESAGIMPPMEEAEIARDEGFATGEFDASQAITQDVERLIIRTGNMSIVVEDTEATMDEIAQMVTAGGGWVVSSSVSQFDETAKSGYMTVRVPAEGFDSALDAISALAVEVTHIATEGQDVTEEYVDLSARLDNLEATAARVRGFLDEARNVEEALAVNQELSRLEGEIESLKGRIQYLEQSAAFSTISIDLTPDVLAQPLEVGGWRPQGVARDALEMLVAALQTLADVGIWLIIFVLPIALLIGIPAWLIIRAVRRRRAARATEES